MDRKDRTGEDLGKELLTVCAWCRKVRNDGGSWEDPEESPLENSQMEFTHGICPDCLEKQKSNDEEPPF